MTLSLVEHGDVGEPAADAAPGARAAMERGDREAAIEILMRSYGDALYHYCYRVLRSRTLADDVHQTVFVQAFEDLGTVERPASLRAWLYSIANHRCLDALKVRRRWLARFTLRDEMDDEMDSAPTIEERAVTGQLSAELDACLGQLPAHVRIAVLLHYQEGFSYEEMERICHERPDTLQKRVARALPLLRRCLERKGVEP